MPEYLQTFLNFAFPIIILFLVIALCFEKINSFIEAAFDLFLKVSEGKIFSTPVKYLFRKYRGFKLKHTANKAIKSHFKENLKGQLGLISSVDIIGDRNKANQSLQEGEELLVVSDDESDNQGSVNQILYQQAKNVIPNQVSILSPVLHNAISFKLAEKFISKCTPKALRQFTNDYRVDYEDLRTSPDFVKIEKIDMKGFFGKILVPDLIRYGNQYDVKATKYDLLETTEAFIDFIHEIADKYFESPIYEAIPLNFKDMNGISTNIMLVGREENVIKKDFTPYIKQTEDLITSGFKHFYILSYVQKHRIGDEAYLNKTIEFAKLVTKKHRQLRAIAFDSDCETEILARGLKFNVYISLFVPYTTK